MVPCPTCQTMIEVPGVDMATVAGVEKRKKSLEKEPAQPLLEEDFDQVIANGVEIEKKKESQQRELIQEKTFFSLSMKLFGILLFAGAVFYLSGLICGLLLARYWGRTAP